MGTVNHQNIPKPSREGFEIVEQPSDQYNCIAYATGDLSKWWYHNEVHYWPNHAARSNTIESLVKMFTGLDFEQCSDGSVEDGYHKTRYMSAAGYGHTPQLKPMKVYGEARRVAA